MIFTVKYISFRLTIKNSYIQISGCNEVVSWVVFTGVQKVSVNQVISIISILRMKNTIIDISPRYDSA